MELYYNIIVFLLTTALLFIDFPNLSTLGATLFVLALKLLSLFTAVWSVVRILKELGVI